MLKKYWDSIACLLIVTSITCIFMLDSKDGLSNYLRLRSLEQSRRAEFKKYLINCHKCNGSGVRRADVNKLIFDFSLSMFISDHLTKGCTQCVKLPYGDTYAYCDTVNDRYLILLREYGAIGPKFEVIACEDCMGMGQFTARRDDGTFYTQHEYRQRYDSDVTND